MPRRRSRPGLLQSLPEPSPPRPLPARPPSPRVPSRGSVSGQALASARRRLDPVTLDDQLGQLDCVRRGTFAQVVAYHPEREAPAIGQRRILADPADEHFVATGRIRGQRVDMSGRVVLHDHAAYRRDLLSRALGRDRLLSLDVAGLRVADKDRHPNGGAGDAQIRQMEDLATLRDDLPFLPRVAVLAEDVDFGKGVEGDGMSVDPGLLRL